MLFPLMYFTRPQCDPSCIEIALYLCHFIHQFSAMVLCVLLVVCFVLIIPLLYIGQIVCVSPLFFMVRCFVIVCSIVIVQCIVLVRFYGPLFCDCPQF